jgi:hypothetical protein
MASFVRYECFSETLAEKAHNLDTDVIKCALSNTAPNVATHTTLADITDLTTGGGYTAGGEDTQNSTSRSGAVTSVVGVDITWTASGATIGPFRYAIIYNDTTSDNLIGYWDYGSSVTLQIGEQFVVNFGASMFTIG